MDERIREALALIEAALDNMQVYGHWQMNQDEFQLARPVMLRLAEKVVRANAAFVSDPETLKSVTITIIRKINDDYGSDNPDDSEAALDAAIDAALTGSK